MLTPSSARHQLEAFEATRAERTQIMSLPKIVGVVFPGNNTVYSYYSDIEGLQVDDYAIVAAPYGDHRYGGSSFHSTELQGFPTVVRIVSTTETVRAISKAAKWIIQKIDIDRYVSRLAEEQKLEVLKAKIAKAKKDALEQLELGRLRSLSPELDMLLDELATLTGTTIEAKPIEVRAHKRAVTRKPRASTGKASSKPASKKAPARRKK